MTEKKYTHPVKVVQVFLAGEKLRTCFLNQKSQRLDKTESNKEN